MLFSQLLQDLKSTSTVIKNHKSCEATPGISKSEI